MLMLDDTCGMEERTDGRWYCPKCRRVFAKPIMHSCLARGKRARQQPSEPQPGMAGNHLHRLILKHLELETTEKCQCDEMVRRMNENGPAWCREHVEEILDAMFEEARRRKTGTDKGCGKSWRAKLAIVCQDLPGTRIVARKIVEAAIAAAERELATPPAPTSPPPPQVIPSRIEWDGPTDVVIPLSNRSKWNDNELRFALRSLETNLVDLGRVFVVGHKPDWLTGVVHIPAEDIYKHNKDANLFRKVLLAIGAGVSQKFVRQSDDQCLLKKARGVDLLPRFTKELNPYEGNHGWWKRMELTRKALLAAGCPARFYDCHLPILCDRDAFRRTAEAFDYGSGRGFCVNTLYCNSEGAQATGHRPLGKDLLAGGVGKKSVEEIFATAERRMFLNYNDGALTANLVNALGQLFPQRSRFEADDVEEICPPFPDKKPDAASGRKKRANVAKETRSMTIAVALLTCDRYEYTVRTVEALLQCHPPGTLDLYHGDDASTDARVVAYVQSKGFKTVMQNSTRLGCSPSTDLLMRAVADRVEPATPILYLQNDLECVRPLPEQQVRALLDSPSVSFVQLSYRTPRTRYARRIPWRSAEGEPWQFGDTTHEVVFGGFNVGMGFQPSVAKIETWLPAVRNGSSEKDYRSKTEYPDRQMARLTLPVFRHIGRRRTPDGQFGKRKPGTRSRVGRERYDLAAPSPAVPMMRRNARQMGATVNKRLCELLAPGMKTLECGSGLSTYLFMALGCEHTSLEHEAKYAPPWPCVKTCKLSGDPAWYDWEPEHPYDFVLIDGPPGRVGREGILRVLDKLVHENTILLFDDTHRKRDRRLCRRVAGYLGRRSIAIPSQGEWDFKKQATLLIPAFAAGR